MTEIEQLREELAALRNRQSTLENIVKTAGGQLATLDLRDGLRRVIGALKTVAGQFLSIRTHGGGDR